MTPDPSDSPVPGRSAAPPSGCPVRHVTLDDGSARMYGPEHQTDPMGMYTRLRAEHGAVAPVLMDGDLPAWLVLGYRENLEVARTPTRFSRDSRYWTYFKEGKVPDDYPLLPVIGWQPLCVFADGEEHERLRSAVTESLGRFDRRGVRRHVTRIANQVIDGFCADGEVDLVERFAEHLPLLVATRLFGMPEEHGPQLVEACRDLMRGTETAFASNEFLTETMRQLVARKRAAPGHDFASWLLEHRSALSDDEAVQHLRLGLLAANENTIILIGNALRMMLTDRRFRASLAGGQMTLPDAIEQLLWDEPPLVVCPGRWATTDTELAGQPIKAGDMLLLGLAAGNTDPEIRPDLTAPMHGNRSHLSFSSGPHECPGREIGRAITETAIDTLLMRLPDLHLTVEESELSWVSSWMYRQLVSLPVGFKPRQPESAPAADRAARPASVPAGRTPAPAAAAAPAGRTAVPAAAAPADTHSRWGSIVRRLRGR